MKNLIKRISLILLLALIPLLISIPAFADEKNDTNNANCRYFLGLTSWDCGMTEIKSESQLKNNIWIPVANVATNVTIIAAYLILGYVIYGGYLYMFSSGDPGKVATAKKTLTHAFIGLAIVMSANLIMSTIRVVLVGNSGNLAKCATVGEGCVDEGVMITNIINWFVGIAGVIAVAFLIYGGVLYITSSGDPGKVKKAKDTIMYALIGLIIVALAIAITGFVSGAIRNANQNAIINTITTKGGL